MKQGYAMGRMPEEIMRKEHSARVREYLTRKYSEFGFKREHPITFNPEWTPEHSRDRYRWVENVSDGLRHVGASHDLVRLRHTGWFVNEFQDETVHGEVYQMPARGGVARYVPAVNDPDNDDCAVLDFHSVTDDKEEAARWADQMAENYAEREREYQAEERARIEQEEAEEEWNNRPVEAGFHGHHAA